MSEFNIKERASSPFGGKEYIFSKAEKEKQ